MLVSAIINWQVKGIPRLFWADLDSEQWIEAIYSIRGRSELVSIEPGRVHDTPDHTESARRCLACRGHRNSGDELAFLLILIS